MKTFIIYRYEPVKSIWARKYRRFHLLLRQRTKFLYVSLFFQLLFFVNIGMIRASFDARSSTHLTVCMGLLLDNVYLNDSNCQYSLNVYMKV